MSSKKVELHFLNRENLAEQGINVPAAQPYRFVDDDLPNVNDEMRNGLDVKANVGSPVFTVSAVYEDRVDGVPMTIIELKFNRIDPTPYSKVPTDS